VERNGNPQTIAPGFSPHEESKEAGPEAARHNARFHRAGERGSRSHAEIPGVDVNVLARGGLGVQHAALAKVAGLERRPAGAPLEEGFEAARSIKLALMGTSRIQS
jgi:hypothetical protein